MRISAGDNGGNPGDQTLQQFTRRSGVAPAQGHHAHRADDIDLVGSVRQRFRRWQGCQQSVGVLQSVHPLQQPDHARQRARTGAVEAQRIIKQQFGVSDAPSLGKQPRQINRQLCTQW